MRRKIFITPWFGDVPNWWDKYTAQFPRMKELGYEWLITHDLEDFNRRCKQVLGFESNIVPGTGKLHDYRCALGALYQKEIDGYDFWGTTDFDVKYQDVETYMPDSHLDCEIFSDEVDYIGGHWTLYKNTERINNLFRSYPLWKEKMLGGHTGWVEKEFTEHAKDSGVKLKFIKQEPQLLIHFNHTKVWPD